MFTAVDIAAMAFCGWQSVLLLSSYLKNVSNSWHAYSIKLWC